LALKDVVSLFGKHNNKQNNYPSNIVKSTFPQNTTITKEINDKVDKSIVYRVFRKDLKDVNDRATLIKRNVISAILRDEMRKEIRENLSIAYSPSSYYRNSIDEVDDGYGLFFIKVETQTKHNELLLSKIDEIVNRLIKDGVSKDELDRLKKPIITAWKTNRSKNILWHRLMQGEITQNLPFIKWQNEYVDELNKVSVESINKEIKAIFDNKEQATYIIKSNGNSNE
jgi:predicted Zn-dependent peptidase